jgi:hypothetical protein
MLMGTKSLSEYTVRTFDQTTLYGGRGVTGFVPVV